MLDTKLNIPIDGIVHLNKFLPRNYQTPILDAIENKGYKRVIAILPRRAGKDVACWNLMIREALRTVGVYYYIFPTYSQAKKVIWESVTNDGMRFLDYIPKQVIDSTNSQEMRIRLTNGSLIQLVGSDNIDSLMGTNPRGIVYSEYALQDPRAYQLLRPALTANQGWAVFISCVSPNTLVIGKKGLKRIKDVSNSREEYSNLNVPIYGIGGFHNAEQFYYGGIQKTLIITLDSGYKIECTPVHPLWNGSNWVKSGDLKIGDELPVQYGQNIWGDGLDISNFKYSEHKSRIFRFDYKSLDSDFFYLLGLIHADGNYSRNKLTITKKKDKEIIDFLNKKGFITRPDGIHHELSSRTFVEFLEFLEFKHGARNKTFPDKLFSCTREQMKSFIQGLFDGDGSSNSQPLKRGTIKLTSTNISFINDLQVVLLNFGIVSGIRTEDKAPTKKVKVWSRIYNLEICGHFAHIFYRDIGFRLPRKQKNWDFVPASVVDESGNVYPVDMHRLTEYKIRAAKVSNPERMTRRMIKKLNNDCPHPYLQELLSEKLYFSPIKNIEESENEVFDFVIPETNSFFTNGLLSHNTPRGKNSLWELWNIAKNNPEDWFAFKLTVEDTQHIDLEEIDRERQSGEMSEDLIQQEYYTSFEMGVEGAYYTKYLDRMRIKGQIGMVPWEPAFPVHTAWDIGIRDSSVIIFFQTIGQTVRIIDYYEKNKEGLEHYATVLQNKEYTYGKHIAPHDIAVREWGSGMTRIEKARQLGIKFITAPDVGIADGIEAVRSMLAKTWIDERACAPLINALENYRQEWDMKKKVYKANPLHNWASHCADAVRYMAVSLPKTKDGLSSNDRERLYREAMYGETSNMPAVFRTDLPDY